MRIAYILLWNVQSGGGISQKVRTQADTWKKLGHDAKLFCNVLGELPKSKAEWLQNEAVFKYHNWTQYLLSSNQNLLNAVEDYQPDLIYLRFEMFQFFHRKLSLSFPVVLELNADDIQEYREIAKQQFTSKVIYGYHRLTRPILFKSVDGIVSVTHEIANLPSVKRYKKPITVLPNTLDLDNHEPIAAQGNNKRPNLLFMGSNDVFWHGITKIIDLAMQTENELDFHLVGNIQPKPGTVVPKNVTFHGYLPKSEYLELFSRIDVGIGSLAFHKKNMYEACSLKTREYLAYGIPIMLGYQDTAFIDTALPEWVLQLPNTPDNVTKCRSKIIDFAHKMKGRRLTRLEVEPFIDAPPSEAKRLQFFESIAKLNQ